ncbi:hypothetical protein [Entomospira culicis]|uniref:PRD domain-containing protein n=1 Tax=Entomospira culicis TaxID=2719989 RepID=A0A968KWY7_9SPIO|nr:hypothetical protein [Entomospira culicis]NIZ19323.1 hypothetical protein [Entomospira culicis]NIZ69772.1 hypothetical protein [Entomospira culicis]WDI36883.1 hypothetical protein PVA46_06030 [Entomospira culicis]WDI38512.1 hypothetical protein PVA47_06040 [Entomospira culicis]
MEYRFLALKEKGLIHEEAYRFAQQARDYCTALATDLSFEGLDMLLTHLSMGFMRQEQAIVMPLMHAEIRQELLDNPMFDDVQGWWQDLQRMSAKLWHPNEIDYIYAHLLMLVDTDILEHR